MTSNKFFSHSKTPGAMKREVLKDLFNNKITPCDMKCDMMSILFLKLNYSYTSFPSHVSLYKFDCASCNISRIFFLIFRES